METAVNDGTRQESTQDLGAAKKNSKLQILQDVQPTQFQNYFETSTDIDTKQDIAGEVRMKPNMHCDTRQSVSLLSGNKRQLKVFDSNVQSKQTVAAIKPVVRTESVDRENQNNMEDGQPSSERRNIRHCDREFKDEIALPCIKIDLLVLGRFNAKHETENTQISYNRNEKKVIFKTRSFDELKVLKLKMYECLDRVVSDVKTLTEQRYQLLCRPNCLGNIQSKSEELENIRVLYQCDKNRKAIRCFAFTEREARKGIQLLEEEITQLKIHIKPSQLQCLSNTTWISLKKYLDVDLTSVFVAENGETIVVEGLIEQEATTAYHVIIRYLKDNMKVKQVSTILESSKARCFQTRFENKLRHKMQMKGGKLDVVTLSEGPLKLQVSVEEESIADELNQVVALIWQENIDIRSISSQADDVWLLTKGLESLTGKEFVSRFEQTHACFVDVSVVEENLGWNSCGTIDDFNDYDEQVFQDDTFTLSDVTCNTHIPEKFKYSERVNNRSRGKSEGAKFRHYQAGMSEEEALQMALEQSVQSANMEECDIKDTGNVRPDWNTSVENNTAMLQPGFRAVYTFKYGEVDNRSVYLNECTPACETKPSTSTCNAAPQTRSQECLDKTPDNFKSERMSRNLYMFRTKVQLIQGQIIQQQADALVNVMSWTESSFDGSIPKSFLDAGGEMLLQMYECVESTSTGAVVVTCSSGQLQHKCSTIFHVKLKNDIPYKKMVCQAVSEIFDECGNWDCKSVAMPPIGVDKVCRYPPADVAETMLTEIGQQLQVGNSKIKTILLVVNDDATYMVFDEVIQTYKQSSVYDNQQAFQQNSKDITSKRKEKSSGSQFSDYISVSNTFPDRTVLLKHKSTNVSSKGRTCDNRSNTRRTGSKARDSKAHDRRSGNAVRHNIHHKGKKRHDTARRLKQLSEETNVLDMSGVCNRDAEDVDDPTPCLNVTITAENKDICMKAREAFENRVKEEFLHEEIVEKKHNLSDKAKHVIGEIVTTNDIKSIEGKDYYILRGHEGMVRKACTEIRKIVIEENSSMLGGKTRHSGIQRDTHEYIEAMMDYEPEVPKYWMNYKQGKSLSSLLVSAKHFVTRSKFELVELGPGRHAFSSIIKMINATFDPSLVGQGKDAEGLDGFEYKKLFVLKIERVENLDLYEVFSRKRQTFYRRLYKSGDLRFPKIEDMPKCSGSIAISSYVHPALDQDVHSEINEFLLFHGTKEENVITICNDGLDPRISNGDSMFGPGIYAAESATKADQYADDKGRRSAGKGNTKKMFLIRMVLGNSHICTKKNPNKFRRPPCTTCIKDDCKNAGHAGKFGHAYDSVVGDNKKLFREFIVYDSSLCYPEYLITYERR
ncbi:uncharacterized protein LOC123556643 [Mercenaria mercenaria]|uniref:uncharacterized protein LOC123556643 n=1 Tax=Mercenaria mercenaria TaxID=6596 RepID=UPI00234F69CA|nr:uncharacterized protein LOC123556643 [Mercenaria mercenaria]